MQDSPNFYLLDVYDNCDGDRDVELVDPTPVLNLKRKEGKRPAILIGLRDNENDSGVIKGGCSILSFFVMHSCVCTQYQLCGTPL